jgi:hypothetical protein
MSTFINYSQFFCDSQVKLTKSKPGDYIQQHDTNITHYWSHRDKANLHLGTKLCIFKYFHFTDCLTNHYVSFLSAFTKLRKTTALLCLSVHPSISMRQLSSHRRGFHEIFQKYFTKICRENSSVIKIQNNKGYITLRRPGRGANHPPPSSAMVTKG